MISAVVFCGASIASVLACRMLRINGFIESLFLFVILFVVFGGNWLNGADWLNYLSAYNDLAFTNAFTALYAGQFEWLFSFVMYLFSAAGLKYNYFVGFVALINVSCILLLFNLLKVKNKETVLVLLFLVEGWTLYHEQLRQSLAVTIGLLAVYLYVERRVWLSCFFIFIAMGFHSTAFFLFFILFIAQKVMSNDARPLSVLWIFGVSVIFGISMMLMLLVADLGILKILGFDRLQSKFNMYKDDSVYGGGLFNFGLLAYALGFALLMQCRKFIFEQRNNWASIAWSCAMLWCLLGPWLRTFSIMLRFEHYLLVFFPFIVGVYGGRNVIKISNFVRVLCFSIFLLTFSVRILISPTHKVWLDDYQNVFFSALRGVELISVEDRRAYVCENLRDVGNDFCE